MSRYLLFHKPYEVLCQFTDSRGRATLAAYISIPDVYPAGRLDYRSEGLLFLTDDGALIQRLTHPRHHLPKTYLAQVEGDVAPGDIIRLNNEIVVSGLQTRLPQVSVIPDPDFPPRQVPVRAYHPLTWLRITLSEGKKHQVRRMTAAIGYPTLRLIRICIGPLEIGNLAPGESRELDAGELKMLRKALQKAND